MNPAILSKILNSIGLIFDIIGSSFVAIEVVNQFKGNEHKPVMERTWNETNPETKEFKKWKKSKYLFMKFGLLFLIIGFILQIFSNWTGYFLINNQTKNEMVEKSIKQLPDTTKAERNTLQPTLSGER